MVRPQLQSLHRGLEMLRIEPYVTAPGPTSVCHPVPFLAAPAVTTRPDGSSYSARLQGLQVKPQVSLRWLACCFAAPQDCCGYHEIRLQRSF